MPKIIPVTSPTGIEHVDANASNLVKYAQFAQASTINSNLPDVLPNAEGYDTNPNLYDYPHGSNWYNALMRSYNQVQISTAKDVLGVYNTEIDKFDKELDDLDMLPQSIEVLNKKAEIQSKKIAYINKSKSEVESAQESIDEDTEDLEKYPISKRYELLSAYFNEIDPAERTVGEGLKYASPNALGSSASFMKSQLLVGAGIPFAKWLIKKAAKTAVGGGEVPFLGAALLAGDLAASTTAIYKQREWETQAEANDAFETIYAEAKQKLSKQYGVDDIEADIINNSQVDPAVRKKANYELRDYRIKAQENIKELRDKNMLHMAGDIAEAYLNRITWLGDINKIVGGTRFTRTAAKVLGAVATTGFEANEEGSQNLYQEIAKEKTFYDKKNQKFANLDTGDSYSNTLSEYFNDRFQVEKAMFGLGDKTLSEDPKFKNAVRSSLYVTGVMSWLPAVGSMAHSAYQYNSLKNSLSKAASTKNDVDNMLLSKMAYTNLLLAGKGAQYKEIVKNWGKQEVFGLDATKAQEEINKFNQLEDAIKNIKHGNISKYLFTNTSTFDNIEQKDEIEAIHKALTIQDINQKVAKLKEARTSAFDKYGFLTEAETNNLDGVKKLMNADPEITSLNTQIEMYEYQKELLIKDIDKTAAGVATSERQKLEKKYKKANVVEKKKLEYIHGNKVNKLLTDGGEQHYIDNVINFFEKFQTESHNDKLALLRKKLDHLPEEGKEKEWLESIVNFAIANNLNIGEDLYNEIKNEIDLDTYYNESEYLRTSLALDDETIADLLDLKERGLLDPEAFENEYAGIETPEVQRKRDLVNAYYGEDFELREVVEGFQNPNAIITARLEDSKENLLKDFEEKFSTEEEKQVQYLKDKKIKSSINTVENAIANVDYLDLGELTEIQKNTDSLKEAFAEVRPDNKLGNDLLNSFAERIKEALNIVKSRLADKQAVQTLSQQIYVQNTREVSGIEETNDIIHSFLKEAIGEEKLNEVLSKVDKENPLHTEAVIQFIKDSLTAEQLKEYKELLNSLATELTSEVLAKFDTMPTDFSDRQKNSVDLQNSINNHIASDKNDYLTNPTRMFINLLYYKVMTKALDSELLTQLYKSQDFYTFLHKVNSIPEDVLSDADKNILVHMINMHSKIIAIKDIQNHLEGSYNPKSEVNSEVDEIEKLASTIFPVEQQFITFRQIVKFLLNRNSSEDFKQVALYFQGVAGAGKTSLVLKLILKMAGIKLDDTYFLASTESTTTVLRETLGVSTPVGTDPFADFLKEDNEALAKKELFIFDEALISDVADVQNNLFSKINEINQIRRNNGLHNAKLIISGDPIQITKVPVYPFIISASGKSYWSNVVFANAMTVSYRTDDTDILLLQNAFKGKQTEVKDIKLARTDDYQSGTYGSSNKDEIFDIIQTRDSSSTSLIIVDSADKLKYFQEQLKARGLESKADVKLVGESQGVTREAVYVYIDKKSLGANNYTEYNSEMYVATGRGKNFVMVVTTDLSFNNSIKESTSKVEDTKAKEESKQEKLKALKEDAAFINSPLFGKPAASNVAAEESPVDNSGNPVTEDIEDIEENREEQAIDAGEAEEIKPAPPDAEVVLSEHNLRYPESSPISRLYKPGDPVFYIKTSTTAQDNTGKEVTYKRYMIVTPIGDNKYALVGVVSTDEVKNLPKVFKDSLEDGNDNYIFESTGFFSFVDAFKSGVELAANQVQKLLSAAIFKGTISKKHPRKFTYTKKDKANGVFGFSPLKDLMAGDNSKLDKIIEKYLKGSYGITRKINYKVVIATGEDQGDKNFPKKGHSYIKVEIEYESVHKEVKTETLWIDLVPRKLSTKKDGIIFEPLNKLVPVIQRLQEITGLTMGSQKQSIYSTYSKQQEKDLPITEAEAFHKLSSENRVYREILTKVPDHQKEEFKSLVKDLRFLVYGKDPEVQGDSSKPSYNLESIDVDWEQKNLITGERGTRRVTGEAGSSKFIEVVKKVMTDKTSKTLEDITVLRRVFSHYGFHVKIDVNPTNKTAQVDIFMQDDVDKDGRNYKPNKYFKGEQKPENLKSTIIYDLTDEFTKEHVEAEVVAAIENDEIIKNTGVGDAQKAMHILAQNNSKVLVDGNPVVFRQHRKLTENDRTFEVIYSKRILAAKPSTFNLKKRVRNAQGKLEYTLQEVEVPAITLKTLQAITAVNSNGESVANNGFGLRYAPDLLEVNGGSKSSPYKHNATTKEEIANNERILDLYETDLEGIENNTTVISNVKAAGATESAGPAPSSTQPGEPTPQPNVESTPDFIDPFDNLVDDDDDSAPFLSFESNAKLGKKVNKSDLVKLGKKWIPGFQESDLEFLTASLFRLAHGKAAWGRYVKGIISLLSGVDGSVHLNVFKHEAFHKMFREFLSENERNLLFKSIKRFTAEESPSDLEEVLAEKFQEFSIYPNRFVGTLRKIFNKIKLFFGFITKEQDAIENIFIDIQTGKFAERAVQENDYAKTAADYSLIQSHFRNKYFTTSEVYNRAFTIVLKRLYHLRKDTNDSGEPLNVDYVAGTSTLKNIPLTFKEQRLFVEEAIYYYYKSLVRRIEKEHPDLFALLKSDVDIRNSISELSPDKRKLLLDVVVLKHLIANKKIGAAETKAGIEVVLDSIYRTTSDDHNVFDEESEEELDSLGLQDEISEADRKDHYGDLSMTAANILATIPAEPAAFSFLKPTFTFSTALELLKNIPNNFKDFVKILDKAVENVPFHGVESVKRELQQIYNEATSPNIYLSTNGDTKALPEGMEVVFNYNIPVFVYKNLRIKLSKDDTSNWYKEIKNQLAALPEFSHIKNEIEFYNMIKAAHKKAIANNNLNILYTRLGSLYKRRPTVVKFYDTKNEFSSDNDYSKLRVQKKTPDGYETATVEGLNIALKDFIRDLHRLEEPIRRVQIGKLKAFNKFNSLNDINDFLTLLGLETLKSLNVSPQNVDIITSKLRVPFQNLRNVITQFDYTKKNITRDVNDLVDKNNTVIKSVEAITNFITRNKDYNFENTFKDHKKRSVYLQINANYGMRAIQQFLSKTFSSASPYTKLNGFFEYNIFVTGLNNILNFANHLVTQYEYDYISANPYERTPEDKDIPYTEEYKKDYLVRTFLAGFVTTITKDIKAKKPLSYLQYPYTPSNRPNAIGFGVNILNPEDLKAAIKLIYKQELLREQRLERAKNNKDKNLNFGLSRELATFNTKNRFVPGLDATKVSETEFVNAALDYINNSFTTRELNDLNLIRNEITGTNIRGTYQVLYDKGFFTYNPNASQQEQVEQLYKTFVIQNYVNGHHLNQLFQGDLAQFKGSNDQIKRASLPWSPGNISRVNPKYALNEKFGILVANDLAEIVTEIQDVLQKYANLHGISYDKTDAICFYTPKRAEEIRKGFGSDTNIMNITKPVFHGFDDFGMVVDLKNSSLELTKELCERFPRLQHYLNGLEYLEDTYGTNFELHFKSGVKSGVPKNLINLENYEGDNPIKAQITNLINKGESVPILALNNADYQIQSNPYHEEGKVSLFSQLEYFLDVNLKNPELSNLIYELDALLMNMGAAKLFKDMGISLKEDGTLEGFNEAKLRSVIVESLKKSTGSEAYVGILEAKDENGKYLLGLNYPGIKEKIVITLSSQFSKKIVKIKATGNKLVLNPNLGIELFEHEGQLKYSNDLPKDIQVQVNRFYKLSSRIRTYLSEYKHSKDLDSTLTHWEKYKTIFADGLKLTESELEIANNYINDGFVIGQRLKMYTGEGPNQKYAEVIAPRWWAKEYGVELNDVLYNRMLGVRIPTTGIHSALPMKIVGFSDLNSNTVIAPQEIVPLHGSDYDVDSLFILHNDVAKEEITVGEDNRVLYKKGDVIGFDNWAGDNRIKNLEVADAQQEIVSEGAFKTINYKTFNEHLTLLKAEKLRVAKLLEDTPITEKEARQELSKKLNTLDKLEYSLYNNIKLYSFLKLITADKNIKDMGTPISFAPLVGTDLELKIFSGEKFTEAQLEQQTDFTAALKHAFEVLEKPFNKDTVNRLIKTSVEDNKLEVDPALAKILLYDNRISPQTVLKIRKGVIDLSIDKNLNRFNDQAEYHYLNFAGLKLVGFFASGAKIYAYLLKGRDSQEKMPKSTVPFELNGVNHNKLGTHEVQAAGVIGIMRNLWETVDTLINLAVDNVKEQKLDIINATAETGSLIMYLVQVGVRFTDVILLMNSKPVRDVLYNMINNKTSLKYASTTLLQDILNKSLDENLEPGLVSTAKKTDSTDKAESAEEKSGINFEKISELENLSSEEFIKEIKEAYNKIKDKAEAKKLYRMLAFKFHPDRGGDEKVMKVINNLNGAFNTYGRIPESYTTTSTEETLENTDSDKITLDSLIKDLKTVKLTSDDLFFLAGDSLNYSSMSKKELLTALKIVTFLQEIAPLLSNMGKATSAISVLRDNKVTKLELDKVNNNINAIDGIGETAAFFQGTHPFQNLDHLKAAFHYNNILIDLIEKVFTTYHPEVEQFLTGIFEALGKKFKYINDVEKEEIRNDFNKYLMSSVFDSSDIDDLHKEVIVQGGLAKEPTSLFGVDAWMHLFCEKLKEFKKDKIKNQEFNAFLAYIHVVTDDKTGANKIKWNFGTNKGGPMDLALLEAFDALRNEDGSYSDVQIGLAKYSAISSGDKFGISSYATYISPVLLAKSFNKYNENIQFLLENPKHFDNIKANYLLNYSLTHIDKLLTEASIGATELGNEATAGKKVIILKADRFAAAKAGAIEAVPSVIADRKRTGVWVLSSKNLESGAVEYRLFNFKKKTTNYILTQDTLKNGFSLEQATSPIPFLNVRSNFYGKDKIEQDHKGKKIHSYIPEVGEYIRVFRDNDTLREYPIVYEVVKKNVVEHLGEEKENYKTKEKYNEKTYDIHFELKKDTTGVAPSESKFSEKKSIGNRLAKFIMVRLAKVLNFKYAIVDFNTDPTVRKLGVSATSKGLFYNGTVLLNSNVISLDTPIHEFAHGLLEIVKAKYPNLYGKLVKEIIAQKDILEKIKFYYPNLTELDQIDEAIVTAIGLYGANMISSLPKALLQLIKNFFNSVLSALGVRYRINQNSTIEDLAALLLSGKELTEAYDSNSFESFEQSYGIKPGVSELFEENPDFSSQIYEALGFSKELNFYKGDTLTIDEKIYSIVEKISSKELAKRNGLTISSNIPVYIVSEFLGARKGGYDTVNNIIILSKDSDKETIHHELIHSVEYNLDKSELNPLYEKVKDSITEDSFNGFVSWNFKKNISEFVADALSKKVFRNALKKEGLLEEVDNVLSVYTSDITPQQKQQALQLYSNFLSNFVDNNFDTIIQDLQTKNILDKKCS